MLLGVCGEKYQKDPFKTPKTWEETIELAQTSVHGGLKSTVDMTLVV